MSDMQFERILTKGEITSLSTAFSLGGKPFSIYVRPKNEVDDVDLIVNCKCICDTSLSALPVPLYDWTPASIIEIGASAINLSNYRVFWGAGNLNI